MATKYYFFKTMRIGGRQRLRPLPGQKDIHGKPIDENRNVQADSQMRESYPIGTVFGSDMIEDRCIGTTEFYTTGRIYPLGLEISEHLNLEHVPPKEMEDAYNEFQGKTVTVVQQTLFAESEMKPAAPGSLLEQLKSDQKLTCPSVEKDGFYVSEKDWWLLVRNIRSKINTMMIGPTGTGKTELIMLACKKLGIRCSVYDMGSMYDPVSGLLGVHRLKRGGESVFDYAQFTQDIQKPGVILLDELSRAPVTTNNILFPCLDKRRSLPVEMAGGEDLRSIKVHPECMFIATANIGAEYTGTMCLDRALVGRFLPLELDYLPVDTEASLLVKRYNVSPETASNMAHVAETVRSLYRKQEISCSISTRETLMAAQMVADGWSAIEAMEMIFLPLFEGTRTEGERSIVAKIFMTR